MYQKGIDPFKTTKKRKLKEPFTFEFNDPNAHRVSNTQYSGNFTTNGNGFSPYKTA
jgi:hypothetical protein